MRKEDLVSPEQKFLGDDITQPCGGEETSLSDVEQAQAAKKITAGAFKKTAMRVFGHGYRSQLFDWLTMAVRLTIESYLNDECGKQDSFYSAPPKLDESPALKTRRGDAEVYNFYRVVDESQNASSDQCGVLDLVFLEFAREADTLVVRTLPIKDNEEPAVLLRAGLDKTMKPESIDFTKLCAFLDQAIAHLPNKATVPTDTVKVGVTGGNMPHC